MATAKRESLVKNFLDQRHPRKGGARKPSHPLRGHRHLVTLSEEELNRREQGWNDRFAVDPPPKSNKALSPAHSPTYSTPPTPLTKESKIRDERAQYGKRGGKRNREPKKPSSGKLMPLGTLSKPPSESAQPSREEKLRFKVLKAIDARETLLYQLSALILCTPVQESLFLPSRPTEPPTSISGGRQQMRSRGGMALASTPLSRHGGNPGAMTNAREATKLAQQLATDLQVAGIQCVEALVEWMLEAGAQAETPPPFLWRGRNYFLKMVTDLDFAETELQARGVNLDCFRQRNPLLIKPNQRLGRVLAAHSIITEMVEFAKEMTPKELLALSGRMRDSSREERRQTSPEVVESNTKSIGELAQVDTAPDGDTNAVGRGESSLIDEQALKRHDHESAADLVDLLDESLDFIRRNASREGDTILGKTSSENEYEDGEGNNGSEEHQDRPPSRKSVDGDYSPADSLEPEEGDNPGAGALEKDKEEAAMPTDNQSDCGGDNSMESRGQFGDLDDVEAATSQAVAAPRESTEDTAGGEDSAHVSNNTTTEDASPTPDPAEPDAVSEPLAHEQLSSRTNASDNQSDYDNSFDAEAGDDESQTEVNAGEQQTPADSRQEESKTPEPDEAAAQENNAQDVDVAQSQPSEPSSSPDKPLTSRTEENEYENSFDEDAEGSKEANSDLDMDTTETADDTATASMVPPILGLQQGALEEEEPVPEAGSPPSESKRLVDELKRWAFLEDENRPTEVNARGHLAWCSTRALTEVLQRHSSIAESVEGSVISMLEQYGLAVPEAPLKSLLSSDIAQELDLATSLLNECLAVLGDVCCVVAEEMQRSLESRNSLVSEIEIDEVLEVAEAVRQEYHDSTWKYLKIATTLPIFLWTSDDDTFAKLGNRPTVSAGLSRLVKVFYPYLVSQPREELSDNWHPASSVLAAMGLPTDRLYLMLDPMCKTLLLAVELCRRSTQDSQDEDDLAVFPKVNVLCDREDVLQSSVEYVWRHHLSSERRISNFSLFPFFKSSFGEKLVDGAKVEEGEGKGPLKEWFGLVGTQLASKWTRIPTASILAAADSVQVTASGNAITIPGAAEVIHPGFQLEWETTDGEAMRRVVNKSVEDDTFLLDRSVSSHAFAASQLRISKPTTAVFEYVQGSESYWLNENTRDSPESRNLLTFVGWFLASAITHFSSVQLRIHALFFRLLLDPEHCVTLEEVQLFDPQLFKSLAGMKDMKPSDFAEYLKFEGADDALSVDAYTAKVLGEKFGPSSGVGWQLQCVRRGFARVLAIDQLRLVGLTEADLAESVCGATDGHEVDFVISEVFRVAADTEFTSCRPLSSAFWHTVSHFEPQLKRKFVKFVTGVETLPLAGTEFLRIEMPFTAISASDHDKSLQMLPQAHTCDNTLELPHYWKALCWREQHDEHEASSRLEGELALLLDKKLRDAVEYSSGYGLDGTSAVTGVLVGKSDDEDAIAKEESFDSLGLPALSEGQSAADMPIEDTPLSPQTSDHEDAEEEAEAKPETAVSPRPEESYDEYDDWEEEEQSVS